MKDVIAFDTETWLIEPGCLAPPLVCYQWAKRDGQPQIRHRDEAREVFENHLSHDAILAGHNVAFDMAVLAAQFPHLLSAIFRKYARDEVTCTQVREQLIMIARGQFRSVVNAEGEKVGVKYSLADCIGRHFGRGLKKEGFRLFYRIFDQVPNVADWPAVAADFQARARRGEWPEWALAIPTDADRAGLLAADPVEAVTYALADGTTTLALHDDQERVAAPGALRDQFRQARGQFCLHLASCWGVYTDPSAVDELEAALEADFEALKYDLQEAGIVRGDGTADTKAAAHAMELACAEEGLEVARTKKGAVSMGAEACAFLFDDRGDMRPDLEPSGLIVAKYSEFLTLRKTLRNDLKMIRAGTERPIQPRYDLSDTGRARASKPNIMAVSKRKGIREAFAPRDGLVFIQADFPSLELYTLAAWCLERIGFSVLGDTLNAGRDVHVEIGGRILGLEYDEALARYKAGDKVMKLARQRAKPINYGLPGGLGAKKLVRYAKYTYGVDMSLEEARQAKELWIRTFPEMVEFFRLSAALTNNPAGQGEEEHVFTGRLRGGCRYSALCNGRFQGLGADCAKEALWRVTNACYVEPGSPLYGARVVAFVHDEIIAEVEEGRCDPAARELARLMAEGANVYLAKVPITLDPLAMRVWSKNAEKVLDANGRIIPWAP
jgi:DNA polymerase-1